MGAELHADTPLVTVAQRMAGEHVHALIVLKRDGETRPWAVLTDRELLRNAERTDMLTAGEVAATELLVVRPTDALADVAERMVAHSVSHAIVVDPGTEPPVGVVSTLDVAGILAWGRA